MFKKCLVAGVASWAVGGVALAGVEQYYGTKIDDPIGFCSFDDPGFYLQTDPYTEGGMTFWIFGSEAWGEYTGCGGDGFGYYPNGGANNPTQIIRADGEDFGALEFQFADGWGQCTNFGYAELYLDGDLVGAFDIDGDANATVVGFRGAFDEVRVGFYFDDATRDLHDLAGYQAGVIDKVTMGAGEGGLNLEVTGGCPGTMTATVSGATPSGNVAFIYAFGTGNQQIPGGACAGTELGLNATAALLGLATADANGEASLSGNAPPAACGRVFLQALDVSTCTTSNVFGI